MTKIISIKPTEEYFSLNWQIDIRCNYDCMYCPAEYHDITSRPHSLETMKIAWQNIYEKTQHFDLKYKITFTGGEVTANKNFLPLVEWLRTTYSDIAIIGITTNGSASINYYSKLAKVVEYISFSTHSEFMDEQEFFDKALTLHHLMVRPEKSLHVNIMDEYWNRDRIEIYQQWLDHHQVSYSINEIDYSSKIRDVNVNKGKLNLVRI